MTPMYILNFGGQVIRVELDLDDGADNGLSGIYLSIIIGIF
jgi:hypothetical protein